MKISLKATKLALLETDTLNLFVWEGEPERGLGDLPRETVNHILEAAKKENFTGKSGQLLTVTSKGEITAYKINITGLGKKDKFSNSAMVEQIAKTIKTSISQNSVKTALVPPEEALVKLGVKNAVGAICEAVYLSAYKFHKYKSSPKDEKRDLEEVLISISPAKLASAEEGKNAGVIVSRAVLYARDLVNEPSHVTTPSFLAAEAVRLGKKSDGKIKVTILDKEEIAKMGMNAFLGVAKGSDEDPKLIILKYKKGINAKKTVIAGKGITFDTGGLSIKPATAMETMKLDMAGAAAILGIFSAVEEIGIEAELTGIIAACENMPSGKAIKPGDILKAYNGKTIEVLNTDAEGRLTLADVLSYAADKIKPDEIIDLATLTGACMAALGEDIAGLFCNDDKLKAGLNKASEETGEKIWELPLEEKYRELNKSKIADVKNIGTGRYAGAITAALFLQEFTGKIPWAHLDIAGPAFVEKDSPLAPYGGSGFGVRLVLHYLSFR